MKRGTLEHPKTKALMRELGRRVQERQELGFMMMAGKGMLFAATGVLECLWHFTAKYAPRGDIGRWSNEDIAEAIGWPVTSADDLVGALVETRWLDQHPEHRLLVHDWPAHCDDLVHAVVARARDRFADGSVPKIGRLPKVEKAVLAAFYGVFDSPDADDTSREEPHQTHTCATHAHEVAIKTPSLAVALPSHSLSPAVAVAVEPAAPTTAADGTRFESALKTIKGIRPEFARLRDIDILQAFNEVPFAAVAPAVADFARDMAGALECPKVPAKLLRGYLDTAARKIAPADDKEGKRQAREKSTKAMMDTLKDRITKAKPEDRWELICAPPETVDKQTLEKFAQTLPGGYRRASATKGAAA